LVSTAISQEIGAGKLRFAGSGLTVAYMFSSGQRLGPAGAWKPHVMIFAPGMTGTDAGGGRGFGANPFVSAAGVNTPPIFTIPVADFIDPGNAQR
jgi:hypothetical protein